MPNYMLRIAFVGTRYHGWQIQPDVPTVQGEISSALRRMLGEEVRVIGCSRTDAGVHALDYVANFTAEKEIREEKILKGLNSMLPTDIGIKEVRRVKESFNARYSVKGKVYLYRILNQQWRDPFEEPYSWRVPLRINELEMRRAVVMLSGRHDFGGFAKLEGEKKTTLDLSIEMSRKGNLISLRFRSRYFLRYMVRRITSALVRVGTGRLRAEDLKPFLTGKKFTHTAPARGLFLEKVIL